MKLSTSIISLPYLFSKSSSISSAIFAMSTLQACKNSSLSLSLYINISFNIYFDTLSKQFLYSIIYQSKFSNKSNVYLNSYKLMSSQTALFQQRLLQIALHNSSGSESLPTKIKEFYKLGSFFISFSLVSSQRLLFSGVSSLSQ
ncbi:hypothetical protein TTHERM_000754729 (macronuclear) [Tetrahymena thermophila SB210]|uniref:Uncharacterized protein n=1 Tax=Tetrahymena thermophila (strain SB210) TaxID=312017 RepID=W7XHI4_TETTS|nr:hypothetical protein TTHERM_000754729 [Tetrahymena thermophila SB210]EWS73831.1 hypothetical protein TTHERM_000754729 [Tetrahymena thermophila SB210]|eukprot:XP_012653654.1 hypothetical protein TTHERM_000754729 [Tetrahymena thermophila SB210]